MLFKKNRKSKDHLAASILSHYITYHESTPRIFLSGGGDSVLPL